MNFKIRDRKFYEELEKFSLAPYATKSENAAKTRFFDEKQHPYRTAFQQDRDRIIHSRAFRRLKHKQQVFLISDGDHYRTRLTHTLEVAQLARTMAKALGLNDVLVEAIALGHDLGHTPFGHVGEVVLNEILNGKDNLDGILKVKNRGGFKHNYQSLRVLDKIEKKYQFDGLNLTSYVREGILKHTRLLRNKYSYPEFLYEGLFFDKDHATTLEGQVVAVCDEIAQRTHDLEDGIRASLVKIEQVRKLKIAHIIEEKLAIKALIKNDRYYYRNRLIHGIINLLVDDVITTSLKNLERFYLQKKGLTFFDEEIVQFSENIHPLQKELNKFIYEEIIYKCTGNDYKKTNKNMLREIFKGFIKSPLRLPDYILKRIEMISGKKQTGWGNHQIIEQDFFVRVVADHIAGMTDSFAKKQFEALKG
ncbi:dNTP triphosphohydrolase [candidate division KSB1 bacterium]|nr:dNTP triphosphohydrolase [candidate division KSB1 bacterium]MBL7092508.1 dNTP triphosphohydrolase [candidate division KSB1 bacterium]